MRIQDTLCRTFHDVLLNTPVCGTPLFLYSQIMLSRLYALSTLEIWEYP